MKKLFLALMLFFVSGSICAVDIIKDVNLSGYRFIQSDYVAFTDKIIGNYSFGLTMSTNGKDTIYSIIIPMINTEAINYSKGMMLAIKLIGGKIITKYTTEDIRKIDNEVLGDVNLHTYRIYPEFHFTKQEIEEMIEAGVGKIRIQTIWKNSYIQFPGEKTCKPGDLLFTTRLQSMYFEIYRRLEEVPNQQSLLEGM